LKGWNVVKLEGYYNLINDVISIEQDGNVEGCEREILYAI